MARSSRCAASLIHSIWSNKPLAVRSTCQVPRSWFRPPEIFLANESSAAAFWFRMTTPDQPQICATNSPIVETDIPARLDRLPWGRFHTLVVAALGITWILDGLEVTLAGTVAGALRASPVLQFSNADVGLAASAYLAGAVLGALFFGWLTDRLGRKKLFFVTLTVYLLATAATAFSWNLWSFLLFRFITGAGIGDRKS